MGPRKYNMLVYNCIVSGSELLSDAHDAEELWGGTWLKVKGTYVTIGGEEDIDIGGNASAEEEAEGTDDNSAQVVDIINNFSLQPMEYSKKQYMSYIKPFLKKCVMYMKENDRADEVDEFKANVQTAIKEITAECEGTTVLCRYIMEGDNCVPYFYYLKNGMKEQK